MTTTQLNKANPEKFVITDGLFFIGALDRRFKHTLTQDENKAVLFTYADTVSPHKLEMAKAETKLCKLEFVLISKTNKSKI